MQAQSGLGRWNPEVAGGAEVEWGAMGQEEQMNRERDGSRAACSLPPTLPPKQIPVTALGWRSPVS